MKFYKILAAAVLGMSTSMTAMADSSTYSGSTLYGYGYTPYMTVSYDTGVRGGAAMQFTASDISAFKGGKITAIAVPNGSPVKGSTATEMPITLFVANALDATLTDAVTFEGVMDLTKPMEYVEYTLPEPIEINDAMTPLYFGFQVVCDTKVANPIAVDYNYHPETDGPGDWFGEVNSKTGKWEWAQLREQIGMNCVRVKIEAENMKANNVQIMEGNLPAYVAPGEPLEFGVYLSNAAFNTVNSVTFKCTVGTNEPVMITKELESPLYYNQFTLSPMYFDIDCGGLEGADIPVKIELSGVNEENAKNNAAYIYKNYSNNVHSFSGGYDKTMVAEIATGTWCGYCPRGIVAVEKMAEYDTEGRFIPIAVHGDDPMSATSYNGLMSYISGYPSVLINRNTKSYGAQDPSFELLKEVYDLEMGYRAIVKPEVKNIEFNAETKKVNVEASAEFALGITGDYAFAYVLLEDEVGPYSQTNYYSPAYDSGMELEWWDQQGPSVSMLYNSVARYIYSFNGVKNSIPATIEAGQSYTHNGAVATNAVSNIYNCSLVLMVINRKTGRIENAVKVPVTDATGIESVEADLNNEEAVYFDLQGRQVAAPQGGQIYIERRGSETRKVRF